MANKMSSKMFMSSRFSVNIAGTGTSGGTPIPPVLDAKPIFNSIPIVGGFDMSKFDSFSSRTKVEATLIEPFTAVVGRRL